MRAIIARVRLALVTWPNARAWIEWAIATGLLLGLLLGLAGAIGFASGLLHFTPRSTAEILRAAATAIVAPALSEELVFRAVLVPGRSESGSAFFWIVVSTALFALWHVVETTFLPGGAVFFRRFDFLALAAVMGLLCAVLRYRSGSLWTAVALHWVVAVIWIGWFGGPSLTELR